MRIEDTNEDMVPTPQHHEAGASVECDVDRDPDRVVVTGMSGMFPKCRNAKEFADVLFNQVDPINESSRWKFQHPELREVSGKVDDLTKFDAQFFKVHYHLAQLMDPSSRKSLEQTYQALYDAGLCPEDLCGKKAGVYIGLSSAESEKSFFYSTVIKTGLGIVGCSKAMFANRISYWLNVNGPSILINGDCCSSMIALEQAYRALKRDDVELAVVGGNHIAIHPQTPVHYSREMVVSKCGKTKCFDKDADGCVLSEGINVIILQKAKNAKRIYATVCGVASEFCPQHTAQQTQRFGHDRNPEQFSAFLKGFYDKAGVAPALVEYVEAFGSGAPEADKHELESLDRVFCAGRGPGAAGRGPGAGGRAPLLVGSVTSNVGYSGSASGVAAVMKVLLSYQKGKIAANLHCDNPRDDVAALTEGRMEVVTSHRPFGRSYVGLNGLSISGYNMHLLMHGYNKTKDLKKYDTKIPRLVTMSGRQESGVTNAIAELKSNSIDAEQIGLLHGIHEKNIPGHLGRGYCILDTDESNKTISLAEEVVYFDNAQRPLVFVYSGMGSQWPAMGTQLMNIPTFARSIQRCQEALNGIDIVNIITSEDKTVLQNIKNCFVGIAAIQIGLTDLLVELGLTPDLIIGHSVGELGCAYADGCMSLEQVMRAAYSRGKVSLETEFVKGAMAAVGLGFKQIVPLCPPEVDVACHNGPESCTVSGPQDVLRDFVAKLTSQGIFAKEVPCSEIAYHSRYIQKAGPALLTYLKEIIPSPKPRSVKWLSTSVPQSQWEMPRARACSAEYHTNNLLNSVLFEEILPLLPQSAVLVEVAPHGLLQAILRRSLPASCIHVPLTRRGARSDQFFLEAVGKLYIQGYHPKVQMIYPKIEYPVSSGTPMLNHFPDWAHGEKWRVPAYTDCDTTSTGVCYLSVSLYDVDKLYLRGNLQEGGILYPYGAMLVDVWDTLVMIKGVTRRSIPVCFRDVHLTEQPRLIEDTVLEMSVQIHKGNGYFEVNVYNTVVMTGYAFIELENGNEWIENKNVDSSAQVMTTDAVYQLLFDRGCYHGGEFKNIISANEDLTTAKLSWKNNWATVIEAMINLNILQKKTNVSVQARYIRNLMINTKIPVHGNVVGLTVSQDISRCGNVLMKNIEFNETPLMRPIPIPTHGTLGGACLEKAKPITHGAGVTLKSRIIGDLESLTWEEVLYPEDSKLCVKVSYAGINVRDAKRASGDIPFLINEDEYEYTGYGMDYSGVTKSGERVMGIIGGGSASTVVAAEPCLLWPVPPHWSLEDAATIPLPYAHAIYCLGIKASLVRGMRVMVHGATGAFGQAAVSIALAHGCEVFATVSDARKKVFLRKLFPEIPDDHIGSSRNESFSDMVLIATKGEGCDIVLSCLEVQFLKNQAINCCRHGGVVLDIQQTASKENYQFGMNNLSQERQYKPVNFLSIFTQNDSRCMKKIQLMLSEGISRGFVRPLSRVTYAAADCPRAFRLLGSSRHRGRVLVNMRVQDTEITPSIMVSRDTSHIVISASGDDGLSVLLADTLARRGAGAITLCHRRDSYTEAKIREWKDLGVDIKIHAAALNNTNALETVIRDGKKSGSVEGIYIVVGRTGAGYKLDRLEKMIAEIDLLSRKMCPTIKYFGIIAEDINVAKNVAHNRTANVLPSTLITLPKVLMYKDVSSVDQQNIKQMLSPRSALDVIERALTSKFAEVTTYQETCSELMVSVSDIAGISISDRTPNHKTFRELGLQSGRVHNVLKYLQQKYEISLSSAELFSMTIARFKELTNVDNGKNLTLTSLFNYVDLNELEGTNDLVILPSLVQSNALVIEFETEYINEQHLILIPGLDGHYKKFEYLCSRVKMPTAVLQPGLDFPSETVTEMATRLVKTMKNKLRVSGNFYLLGYSFGALVALEMAAILESQGYEGIVYCVDASPDTYPEMMERLLKSMGATSDEDLQDALIRHMYSLIMGQTYAHLEAKLQKAGSWKEKVAIFARELISHVPLSSQYARSILDAAYHRILEARRYDPKLLKVHPLKSKIVLLKSISHSETTPNDLGLSKYSQQDVAEFPINAPHGTVLKDVKCSYVVNKYLSRDILTGFDSRNLCEKTAVQGYKLELHIEE